jgi:5-methyltetrahydrofolate--homocysteine methyltransferase
MQTRLCGTTKQVLIEGTTPLVIIGESINPTRRKRLIETLQAGDFSYVEQLARSQIDEGADVLDINVGIAGGDEVTLLPQVVKFIAERFDVPLCLDCTIPKALAAALAVAPGKPLVNSVNGEERSLNAVLPIVKEYGAAVIGLTIDDTGIPKDVAKRMAIAEKIIERAGRLGIPADDVIIDPLAMAVGADDQAGVVTLQTIAQVRREFRVNVTCGGGNVSFGLPDRHTVNQAFLVSAMAMGLTCAITDPVKLASTIRATDLMLGRDGYASRYIRYWRAHKPKVDA